MGSSRMVRGLRSSWIDRVMYLLLGFFVIATIGQALVGGTTLLDVNLLTHFQPFQALHGQSSAVSNLCRSDTVDSVMPGIKEIRTRLLQGDFPGWSSSEVGGAPLAGIPNLGQFSPLALPYYLLPLWLAPAFVKLAEFVVAIGGMVLYLRRLRLSIASGVLAGIVFAASGFMLSWTNWPQTRVAALIPLLFWAVERLIQRHRLVDALPLAAVTASMLLGGFPAVTGMTFYFAGLYFLIRIVILYRSRWRTLLAGTSIAVLGLVLGAALTAFQLLPFARQLATMNLGYRNQSPTAHSTLSTLLTTMVPDSQGLLCNGKPYASGNPIENLAFIGVAGVLLALIAVTVRARKPDPTARGVVGFLAIATVFVVVAGWQGGELLSMLARLPVFSQNLITRIRSVFGFLLAALAGFGFEKLLSVVRDEADGPEDHLGRGTGGGAGEAAGTGSMAVNTGPQKVATAAGGRSLFNAHVIWSVAVTLTAVVFGAYILIQARDEARAYGVTAHLRTTLIAPAILLAICPPAIVAVRFRAKWVRSLAIVIIAMIAVGQSAFTFRESIPGSDPANFYPVTSTHRFLLQNLGFDRFAGSGLIMYPATSEYYGLRTPTGHQFTTDPWKALLHAVDPTSQITPTFSDFNVKTVNAGSVGRIPLLDQMAVRYFVAPDFDVVGKQEPAPATRGTVTLATGQVVQCPLPAGPLRAVTVRLAGPLVGSSGVGATVHVRIHTSKGDITGARSQGPGLTTPAPISVAVPGEDESAAAETSADVWVTGASAPFALAGDAGIPACGTVTPTADGLKLVASDAGAIVYQRLTSLPRIRWASTSRVQTDPNRRVSELKAGIGATSVLLDTAAPKSEHKPATVKVTAGDGDRLAATVNATGAGYLVIADSMQQPGWTATIDGRPTELVPANNAMVAVRVPTGLHRVELVYTVPGQQSGLLISCVSLLVVGALLVWWRRSRASHDSHRPTTLAV
jgi:Bacterial membrane protein YfhO